MRIKIAVTVALLAAAWAVGFWPERGRRRDVEGRLQSVERELAECRQRTRVAALLGRLLGLGDAVAAKNYGIAQGLASSFFDALRDEAGRSSGTEFQPVLGAILEMRDPVTAGLTRADPAAEEMVRAMQGRLRSALGYGPPPGAQPAPSPAPTPSPGGSGS